MHGRSLTERGGVGVQIVGDDIATGWVMGYGSQWPQGGWVRGYKGL